LSKGLEEGMTPFPKEKRGKIEGGGEIAEEGKQREKRSICWPGGILGNPIGLMWIERVMARHQGGVSLGKRGRKRKARLIVLTINSQKGKRKVKGVGGRSIISQKGGDDRTERTQQTSLLAERKSLSVSGLYEKEVRHLQRGKANFLV